MGNVYILMISLGTYITLCCMQSLFDALTSLGPYYHTLRASLFKSQGYFTIIHRQALSLVTDIIKQILF